MSLIERIDSDYKTAFRAGEHATVSTLRVLKSALKNKRIDKREDLTEEEVEAVVRSQVKQLVDAKKTFEDAGRADLAEQNAAEIALLEVYLPAQMSDEELEAAVRAAIEETGASSKADMGKVMGAAMKKVAGGADGNRVKAVVSSLLATLVLFFVALPTSAAVEFSDKIPVPTYVETLIRIARIGLVVVGIYAVVEVLRGAFGYMLSSNRDELHVAALRSIMVGLICTILVVGLFSVATVALNQFA